MRRRSLAALSALSMLAVGLAVLPGATAGAVDTPPSIRGSIEQIYVWDVPPGGTVELLDATDAVISSTQADAQGAALFKDGDFKVADDGLRLTVGEEYRARVGTAISSPVTVLGIPALGGGSDPDQSFYAAQSVDPGYGYLTTRDGTTLSLNVSLPDPGKWGPGPYPTVVEYSGYSPSNPSSSSLSLLPFLYNGYATVAVNMRGTGCSGGAYWYSEPAQATDGYDIIETIAAQPWSAKVGMVGISFSGISQLYVAAMNPPHLAAITPMSVIADTYRSTLYPGGILNDGFALDWAIARVNDTQPGALGWVNTLIANGDTVCEQNMTLRLQHEPIQDEVTPVRYWEERGAGLAPRYFVNVITAPTMLIGAAQDEQTGGHFATMLEDVAPDVPRRFVLVNGTHAEGMFPYILQYAMEWSDFYIAERKPFVDPLLRTFAPPFYEPYLGAPAYFGFSRFAGDDYATALAKFEAEPEYWVFWESGAGALADPGAGFPVQTRITKYDSFPPSSVSPLSLYLGPDGTLGPNPSSLPETAPRASTSWTHDESTGHDVNYAGSYEGVWHMNANYDWQPIDDLTSASFVSEPMTSLLTLVGGASADLWIRSSHADVDLEVTLSEVRPDGQEMYIQSGWLRASQRALDPARSTELAPFHTHLEEDAQPLPADEYSLVRIELTPFAHMVRPGSRVRLTVDAPGGNRSLWTFDVQQNSGTVVNEVAHDAVHLSTLVLPKVANIPFPPDLPPCPYSVRSQPCRAYAGTRSATGVAGTPGGAWGSVDVTWTAPSDATGLTGSTVRVLPTNEELAVGPGETSVTYQTTDLDTPVSFVVTGDFGGTDGPASSASLAVLPTPPPDFLDVAPSHLFYKDIRWMRFAGITDGFPDNTYRPTLSVTRGSLVQFLYRMAGQPAGPFPNPGYSDVSPAHSFYTAIAWAAANDVIGGYPDGSFRPGTTISRQGIAATLYRLAGSPPGPFADPGFSDVPGTHLFADAIWWAAANDVVGGYPDGTFRPTAATSRQGMAALLASYAALP